MQLSRPPSLPQYVWDYVSDPARLQAVASLAEIGSVADSHFDRLTKLAASLFQAPYALVTMLDTQRQRASASFGETASLSDIPAAHSFCAYTIADGGASTTVTLDARADPRFADNPLVTDSPFIRFYAGAPVTSHGHKVGSVCVLSPEVRGGIDPDLLEQLTDLAAIAGRLFELKDEARVRARTAAELIKEEWRHALTLEAGKVGSWVWELRSGTVTANDILRRMFNLSPSGQIFIDDIFAAIHPGDLERVREALEAAFERGVDYSGEFRTASADRWLMGRGRVYQRDAEGKPLIMMGINIDITETRQAADHTRLLLRELNHRVKNTLAMIQSLARQTMRQNADPNDFIEAFSGRLRTLSDAHVLLANRDWSGIHLKDVIAGQVGADRLDSHGQVRIEGEDVDLPPDHALGLGVILHELTSNAVNHGALTVPEGRVSLNWRVRNDQQPVLDLTWRETNGPAVSSPQEYGLGARLIERSLAKILGSHVSLEFSPGGVEAHIVLPLATAVPQPQMARAN